MSSELTPRGESVQLRLSADGMIQAACGDTQALLGRAPQDLLQTECLKLVTPGSQPALRCLLNTTSDRPRVNQFRLTRASGDPCSTQWVLTPAGNDETWCVISTALPEHAPHDLPMALADVLDRANHVVFMCDPLGHFINLNSSLTRITGYTRRELETRDFNQLVHPEDRLFARSMFLMALGGTGQRGEIRVFTKNGHQHHLTITNGPLWSKDQIIGVVGVASDVTAERTWSKALADSQARLEETRHIAELGCWRHDFRTRKSHWSRELFALLGIDPRNFSNDYIGFRKLIHPDDVQRVTCHHRDALRSAYPIDVEFRIVTPEGKVHWVRERGEVTRDSSGRPLRIEGTLQNLSKYRKVEQELNMMRDAMSQIGESLFILDDKHRVLSANGAFCHLMRCSRSAIQDLAPEFLLAVGQPITELDSLWQHLKTVGSWQGPVQGRRLDGTPLAFHLSLSAVRSSMGRITHYVGVCRDTPISAEQFQVERSQTLHIDAVTALPNRQTLMHELVHHAAATTRQSDQLALLWIDLDHFRSINESLDPAVGDEILRDVAQRFRDLEDRPRSKVFHVGGDAFAVVVAGASATSLATTLAQSLLEALNRPLLVAGTMLGLSASIGIAVLGASDEEDDAADLIRQAETAMYQAKRHRHCYRLASRARKPIDASPMGAHELRQALRQNELFLVYQPIFGKVPGQVSSVEALVRWAHPTRGILSPNSFLPLAERIGLLPVLGQQVLDMALRQLALWQRFGSPNLRMAVNVAPAQFANPQLPGQIAEALQRNRLTPDALMLEITENALIAHPDRALESLRALREIGVQIAIDDFGMGYSSFSYLKQYPFDALKIDRSFVSALPGSEQDAAIVEAMLSMSRRLQLDVIAEGVETEAQWAFLTERGCQELQGFWLSRPLSEQALGHLLLETAGGAPNTPR